MKISQLFILLLILVTITFFIFRPYIQQYILRNLAIDVCKTLNKHNVDYWVDFGTLLGIVREKDIILRDEDVDVVIVNSSSLENQMKLVMNDLEKMGYFCKKEETWDAYRAYTTFGFYVDMYINKRDDENKIYLGSTGETSNISYSLIGKPIFIKWNQIDVRVPENIHDVLLFRYGKDYMIPKNGFKGRNP
jgi:phosphorylcholine metabolism protein LicD